VRYDIIVFGFFALFALGIAAAIYISDLRAPSPERRYIYSLTDAPTMRTPKRAVAAFACCIAIGLGIFTVAVASNSWGNLLTWPLVLTPGRVLQWLAVLLVLVGTAILIGATRPIRHDTADTDEQG
jgi:hypothetical protein